MLKKRFIKTILHDRTLVLLTIAMLAVGLVLIVGSALQIRPSDIQLPVRYSGYGVTTLYREKWYYLLSFVVLGVILMLHPLVAAKLAEQKGRQFAIGFLILSLAVGVISLIIAWAVFRLAAYSL